MMRTDTYLELNDGDMELRATLHEIYVEHKDITTGVQDKILSSVLHGTNNLLDFSFSIVEETSSLYSGGTELIQSTFHLTFQWTCFAGLT